MQTNTNTTHTHTHTTHTDTDTQHTHTHKVFVRICLLATRLLSPLYMCLPVGFAVRFISSSVRDAEGWVHAVRSAIEEYNRKLAVSAHTYFFPLLSILLINVSPFCYFTSRKQVLSSCNSSLYVCMYCIARLRSNLFTCLLLCLCIVLGSLAS